MPIVEAIAISVGTYDPAKMELAARIEAEQTKVAAQAQQEGVTEVAEIKRRLGEVLTRMVAEYERERALRLSPGGVLR